MLDLAKKVIGLTASKSKIVFKALPEDDPKQRKPDISIAKSTLNWEPKINLEDGLKKTIAFFRGIA
jgi:UDP-glucuronate decarboxylase